MHINDGLELLLKILLDVLTCICSYLPIALITPYYIYVLQIKHVIQLELQRAITLLQIQQMCCNMHPNQITPGVIKLRPSI